MKINTLTVSIKDGTPIYKQLYLYIKDCIVNGQFSHGDVLPSSRYLASDMGISRTSVLNAYNNLIADGYITSKRGSGYMIIYLPVDDVNGYTNKETIKNNLSRYYPFNPEPIDTSFFPSRKWTKIISKVGREKSISLLYTDHYDKFGNKELRRMICIYIYEKKGIRCTPEQVIITSGTMESLEICISTLTKPGQILSIEDPSYPPMHNYLKNHNRKLNYIQVDTEGACYEHISNESNVVILTPGSQFPLGISMSSERKRDFINWAMKRNGWIIEDDYDSDFITDPIQKLAIFSLDSYNRTLYLGSFSRLITSELRVGFIIIPEHIRPLFDKQEYSFKTSYLPQLVLSEFIKTGDFYRNLSKAKLIYTEKKAFFLSLLYEHLTLFGFPFINGVGSFIVFILDSRLSDQIVVEFSKDKGLELMALSTMCHAVIRNGLFLGFINFEHNILKESVLLLKEVLYLFCLKNNIDLSSPK